jgi:hypothetical protein
MPGMAADLIELSMVEVQRLLAEVGVGPKWDKAHGVPESATCITLEPFGLSLSKSLVSLASR